MSEIVPPRLGDPELSQPEFLQDPGTWGRQFRILCYGEPEGEEDLPSRFLEVAKSPKALYS